MHVHFCLFTHHLIRQIPEHLYAKAQTLYDSKIKHMTTVESATKWISQNGVVKAHWCEEKECFDAISAIAPSVEAIGTLTSEQSSGKCIVCDKSTTKLTLFGRTY